MKASAILSQIKKDLDPYVGQKVRVKANKGRRRIVEREGILERTYQNIFVVKLEGDRHPVRRISYSYADILTEAVELVVPNKNGDLRIHYQAH